MKNFTKFFLAVVALFAYSCVTDTTEDLGVKFGGQTEVQLSLEGARTHIAGKNGEEYPLYWSEGDKIAVNGFASEPLAQSAHGTTAATFVVNAEVDYPYNIVYPAPTTKLDITLDDTRAEGMQVVTFLAEQPYTAGTFAEGAAPMYALVAEAGTPSTLSHLAGVLRIAPKGDGVTLTSMSVSSELGKIAGNFDVNCADGTLVAHEDATNVVNVTFGEGLTLGAEATPIYVAVPAGEYGIFTITLHTATDSMTLLFSSTGDKAVKAGLVREFKEFEYKANAGVSSEFLIDSKEALFKFAQMAANFAPYTSAKVVANIDLTGVEWTPIEGFACTFDGGKNEGFEIKGLTAPLFGTISGNIKNVKLTNVNIVSNTPSVSSLACKITGTESVVENCSAEGSITINAEGLQASSERLHMAGLVGRLDTTAECKDLYNAVNISVSGSIPSKLAIGGVFASTDGAMRNAINIGTITYNGTQTQSATLYVGGVCMECAGMYNCTNGSADDKTHSLGAINIAGSTIAAEDSTPAAVAIGGLADMIKVEAESSYNYGNITYATQNAYRLFIGGLFRMSNDDKLVVTGCENHGNISAVGSLSGDVKIGGFFSKDNYSQTCNNCKNYGNIVAEATLKSANVYLGGMLGAVESEKKTKINGCANYGTIESYAAVAGTLIGGVSGVVSKGTMVVSQNTLNDGDLISHDQTITGNCFVGGVTGKLTGATKDKSTSLTISDFTNSGDISVATTASTIQIGGMIGRWEKGNQAPSCGMSWIKNSGDLTVSGSVTSSDCAIGGIAGFQLLQWGSCNGNWINEGTITFSGSTTSGSRLLIGGIIGATDKDLNATYIKPINIGNIVCTGKVNEALPSNKANRIGGIVGQTIKAVKNAQFYGSIQAVGYPNVGVIVACPMTTAVVVWNYSLGGSIATTNGEDGKPFFKTISATVEGEYVENGDGDKEFVPDPNYILFSEVIYANTTGLTSVNECKCITSVDEISYAVKTE